MCAFYYIRQRCPFSYHLAPDANSDPHLRPVADRTGTGSSFLRLLIRPVQGVMAQRQAKANNALGPSWSTLANGKFIKVLVWKLRVQCKKPPPRILLVANTHCVYLEFASNVKATHSRHTLHVINWPADTFMHLQLHSYCVNTRVLRIGKPGSPFQSNPETHLHRALSLVWLELIL